MGISRRPHSVHMCMSCFPTSKMILLLVAWDALCFRHLKHCTVLMPISV